MAIRRKKIKAGVEGLSRNDANSRYVVNEGTRSKSQIYRAGSIERKTVVLQGEKENFIYNYNIRNQGGIEKRTFETASDAIEWIQKNNEK